jgi:Ca-activated chloride channel family protein
MLRSITTLIALVLSAPLALADGFIIVPHPPEPLPTIAPLEVSYHRVKVKADDTAAVTTIDQEFYNPSHLTLEGTYIFPLPAGAHVDRFVMEIDGKPMEAELLPADKAKAIYEDIVRRRKDPALLEYIGKDIFKARIFPIEPRSRKRITIQYTQLLRRDGSLIEYVYPLNTEKFSSKPLADVSVRVELATREAIKSVYCPTHAAEVRREGETRAVIGWEERNVKPDTDFKVLFRTAAEPVALSLLTHRPLGSDEGFFLLLASPGLVKAGAAQPKDIVFVLDTSGSMSGGKLDQAKKAMRFCLDNLSARDRFDVIRFSTDAESYFGGVVPADIGNLAKAETFVDGLKPMGGTAIADALERALDSLKKTHDEARPAYVIFMTDGLPTVGETRDESILKRVKERVSKARVFSLGVGADVNTQLLDRIAADTRGANQFVLPKEDLEVKLSNLYMKVRDPALTDVSLSVSGDVRFTQMYPRDLPDLFSGDSLVIFGKYTGSGRMNLQLSGRAGGERREFSLSATAPEKQSENDYIARLWATRRVGWLLDEIRQRGESSELRDEVTRLARQYAIVTPYTSYLILEDEARRNVPMPARTFAPGTPAAAEPAAGRVMYDAARKEADGKGRSGEAALENAVRLDSLKQNSSLAGTVQASAPMVAAGNREGLQAGASQQQAFRMANGRPFYQNGNRWVDSQVQTQKNARTREVKFGSDEYFALLKAHPEMMPSFALGQELDLVIGDTLYQVRG